MAHLTPVSAPWRLLPPPSPWPCKYQCPIRRRSACAMFRPHPSAAGLAMGPLTRPTPLEVLPPVQSKADMQCPSPLPQRIAACVSHHEIHACFVQWYRGDTGLVFRYCFVLEQASRCIFAGGTDVLEIPNSRSIGPYT